MRSVDRPWLHDGVAHGLYADVLDGAPIVLGHRLEAGALETRFLVVFTGDARDELLQCCLDAGIGFAALPLLPQHRGDGMDDIVLGKVQARQARYQLADGL